MRCKLVPSCPLAGLSVSAETVSASGGSKPSSASILLMENVGVGSSPGDSAGGCGACACAGSAPPGRVENATPAAQLAAQQVRPRQSDSRIGVSGRSFAPKSTSHHNSAKIYIKSTSRAQVDCRARPDEALLLATDAGFGYTLDAVLNCTPVLVHVPERGRGAPRLHTRKEERATQGSSTGTCSPAAGPCFGG